MGEETHGEYLVGISFNPGGNPDVNDVKRKAADLIDAIKALRNDEEAASTRQSAEAARCKSIAITHVETAAMFAVKAATKPA